MKHLIFLSDRALSWLKWAVLLLAATCFSALLQSPAHANIYHFVGEDGSDHFSDQISDPRYKLLLRDGKASEKADVKVSKRLSGSRAVRELNRIGFEEDIQKAALSNRVDAALLRAVVEVESGYNPRAVSPKGAMGLMQLMPSTALRYGVVDAMDASQNLRGGAHHLRDLLDQFAGDHELALAAYNAGAGAVLAHGRQIPPFAETRRYVPAVMQLYLAEKR